MAKLTKADFDEEEVLTIITEDDQEVDCLILTILEIDDMGDYIALIPIDGIEDEEGEMYIYRYSEDEDENPILGNIESDEEFEAVSAVFDEFIESEVDEYDEIVTDEEIEEILNKDN